MSISFFVANEKLTDKHVPIKCGEVTLYIRSYIPPEPEFRAEHPDHAAARNQNRMMDGEIFLNAIPDNFDVKNHKAAFSWKKDSAGADALVVPSE